MTNKSKIIAQQNDIFRKHVGMLESKHIEIKGKYHMTQGVDSLSNFQKLYTLIKLWEYNDFNDDNDPYGEYDYGRITLDQNKQDIIWKIDYYDTDYLYGSEDPTNPNVTRRVLTLMLPKEY